VKDFTVKLINWLWTQYALSWCTKHSFLKLQVTTELFMFTQLLIIIINFSSPFSEMITWISTSNSFFIFLFIWTLSKLIVHNYPCTELILLYSSSQNMGMDWLLPENTWVHCFLSISEGRKCYVLSLFLISNTVHSLKTFYVKLL
jgi:hypothetical protein